MNIECKVLKQTYGECMPQVLQNPVSQGKIAMLVLSPTRELAAQIAEEARQLLKFQRMHVQARIHSGAATVSTYNGSWV